MTINESIVNFFKKHNLYDKKMFSYFEAYGEMVDYYDPNENYTIGVGHDMRDGKLNRFSVVLPIPVDEISTTACIFHLTEAIEAYKHLGKEFDSKVSVEAIPMLYEKLYVEEANDARLTAHKYLLDTAVTSNSPEKYR